MKLKIKFITDNNVYYKKSPDLFIRLVKLLEEHPYSYGQMLSAKGRKRQLIKNPDYIPPYRDIYDWINTSLPLLSDNFFKLSTKCYWILNGLTGFPKCSYCGCQYIFEKNNVEMNQGYPQFCVCHSKCDPRTIEKRKASSRIRFGADHPMKAAEIKEKLAATNFKLIGYATPLASPEHRKMGEKTKLDRYGNANYNNSKQAAETYREHAKNPGFLLKIRRSMNETNVGNGHDKNWTNRGLAVKTRLENNNGKYWTDKMTAKSNATIEAHKLENPNYAAEKQEKTENTVFEKTGVKCVLQSNGAKRRLQEWIDRHGGGTNPFQTDYAKEKSRRSMRERHGVDYAMQSPKIKAKYDFQSVQLKIQDSKRRNGTFNTSKPEEESYKMLCEKYGVRDVERQYRSERYPFRCDFYVKSTDTYIECNYHWTHGGHWFDASSEEDMAVVDKWKAKGTAFYSRAVRVWTLYDVRKRAIAEMNGLNYLVFWKPSQLSAFLNS